MGKESDIYEHDFKKLESHILGVCRIWQPNIYQCKICLPGGMGPRANRISLFLPEICCFVPKFLFYMNSRREDSLK